MTANPVGLRGIAFVEFAGPKPEKLIDLLRAFGFSKTHDSPSQHASWHSQGDIHCVVHESSQTHGAKFSELHGPCIPAMGWFVDDPHTAFETAVARGATPSRRNDWSGSPHSIPAIEGIGGSLIYFVGKGQISGVRTQLGFKPSANPFIQPDLGFRTIDHLTNNVEQGQMAKWAKFYKEIFGFTEVRYFDIRGAKTGLTSYALRSPCGTFCIPINEGTEAKSQINEYLREYNGPGIQHLAFTTDDIISSIRRLRHAGIETLDIDDEYYEEVFRRVPNVVEAREDLQQLEILVDGDDQGYLLQIFTKNIIGPIFIEIIQRKNHLSFGEGNFQALFRSLERDQQRRGVL